MTAPTGLGWRLFKFRGLLPAPGLLLLAWVSSPALGAASVLPGLGAGPGHGRWFVLGLALALLGQAIRFGALRAIGPKSRVSSKIRTEELITTGVYSVVRNPLYTGNVCMAAGVALAAGWWPLGLGAAVIGLVYYGFIIRAEEAALAGSFGSAFDAYRARTPRLIPAPHRYRPLAPDARHPIAEWFPRELNTVTALLWAVAIVGRGLVGVTV